MQSSSAALRSSDRNLLCKNGCGFFGNPEWQWYCSKCWRDHQTEKARASAGPGGRRSTQVSALSTSPRRRPENVPASLPAETGKSQQSKRLSPFGSVTTEKLLDKNLKQIFRKGQATVSQKGSPEKKPRSGSSAASPSSSGTSTRQHEYPPESKAVSSEFAAFLNQRLERPGVADISRQLKGLIDKIAADCDTHEVEDLSAMVQEFYLQLRRRLDKHQHFQKLTDGDKQVIIDLSEKYTMICCYRYLFCPSSTTDEEKDLEIQARIRRLNWISTRDLSCPINESSQQVRDLLHEAINDILEMDGKMAPQDKLHCLVKCCKGIFEMLRLSNESTASADDFVPCLIYVCLKANPPRIQSNIHFITRFCNEDKVRMGEAGYFFVSLCCAMSFIETMTAERINMDPDEFDSYVSGRVLPPGSWQSSLLMCEGLQVMSQNLKVLGDLRSRYDRVLTDTLKLQQEMTSFQLEIGAEVQAVLHRTAYEIRPAKPYIQQAKVPVALDDDLEAGGDHAQGSLLPPPLVPTLITPAAAASGDARSDVGLEDFLSGSCAGSELSFSMADASESAPDHEPGSGGDGASADARTQQYRGFSAQRSAIPSISCDNQIVSSPSTASAATSPNSSRREDREEDEKDSIAIRVLSGVMQTFDNLI